MLLLILMITSAFAEVISLGAVLPFISVLTAPDQLMANSVFADVVGQFGVTDGSQLVLPVTLLFATAAIAAAVVRIALVRANTRLAYSAGADLGFEIYRRTLYQPYEVHLARNSSEIVSGVTRKVDSVVSGILLPTLTIAGTSILFVSILAALFFINWPVALSACLIFGSSYALTTIFVRQKIKSNGKLISREHTRVFQALHEGLAGIRDVLLSSGQDYYTKIYRRADVPLRRAQGDNNFLSQFPRYALEALGMVLIAILAYVWTSGPDSTAQILPTLAAVALGGQRLLPALQQSYAAWSSILGASAILEDTLSLLEQPLPASANLAIGAPLPFDKNIVLEEVSFKYMQGDSATLNGINLEITKGARVGIVGQTGAGKSTLIDILMGLLAPSSGKFSVDNTLINEANVRAWQQNISHVPQSIYLTDASFMQNIALGVAPDKIDFARVKLAAEQAQISGFIEKQPDQYHHQIGENGARLSGGQRQRIGIARALYRDAELLVLDEATSALDSKTEQLVIESIAKLNPSLTIIMIAHRLSTLDNCTQIIELSNGQAKVKAASAKSAAKTALS